MAGMGGMAQPSATRCMSRNVRKLDVRVACRSLHLAVSLDVAIDDEEGPEDS